MIANIARSNNTERLADAGIDPSVGSVGDSSDNALAETVIGLFKTEASIAVARGVVSKLSNTPRSNGSTGSTIDVCSSLSETSRQQKPRTASMHETMSSLWWRDSNQMASGKPGAVHFSKNRPIFVGYGPLLIAIDPPRHHRSVAETLLGNGTTFHTGDAFSKGDLF